MFTRLLLTLTLGLGSVGISAAQEAALPVENPAFAECGCLVPAGGGGVFTEIGGQVLVSAPEGFVPASPGVQFLSPSEVLAGSRSSASILLTGGCTVSLGEFQTLALSQPAGATEPICARVVDSPAPTTTVAETTVTPEPVSPLPYVFGAGVIAAFATAIFVSF